MSEVYFTSDHHFGHSAVLGYSKRPFASVEEMDSSLITTWNAAISPKDVVYHLGDVSFHRANYTARILDALNGTIHLVRGNHDKRLASKGEVARRFSSIQDYLEVNVGEQKLVLCHYPFLTWNKGHHGSWHLHGHSHGNLTAIANTRLDVGVDAHAMRPWHFMEIVKALAGRTYQPVDHHVARP